MGMQRAAGWFCAWLVLLSGAATAANPQVPPALKDWQAWVLHGHEQQTCPLLSSPDGVTAPQCVWPGHLTLVADRHGAQFRLDVRVEAESDVALPGNRDAWPQDVRVGTAAAVVLDRNGVPTLRLPAGKAIIEGTLHWDQQPARLRLPASIALVDLSVDGTAIAQPERNGDWITLGPGSASRREADALNVRVFRRLSDGTPPMLETRVRLQVAGSAREQLLGPALPEGFVATSLAGGLPARLDPDGRLRVQLRPGNWMLTLDARGTAPLGKLQFTPPPAPWPQQEVWSYADAPALRTTHVAGLPSIDPGQADVPPAWQDLPAYVMKRGAIFTVEQRARGRSGRANRLHLTRALWLDFNGGGLVATDHLTGILRDADRLDAAAPWQLTDARRGDDGQPLLVTRGAQSGTRGVELRTRTLDLHAGLRRAGHGGPQSATGGWQQTLDGVKATLHLPYGYRLLGAPGADHSPDSWVAHWNLLDLFVTALIALLVWRLLGWPWALVALGFVVLSHGEPGAPRWLPAIAVVLGLVARVLPAGRLRKTTRYTGIAALVLAVLATLPFAAVQLRDAMHPQLESTGFAWIAPDSAGSGTVARTEFLPPPPAQRTESAAPAPPAKVVMSTPVPPPPPPPADMAPPVKPQTLQAVTVTGSQAARPGEAGYPPDTVLQSGPGVPGWASLGSRYRLGWSGPVTAQQTWRLVILPAWATRILRVVMLALLVAWLLALARALDLQPRLPRGMGGRGAAGVAGLLLLAALAPQARAQTLPSPELLSQLRARLLEAPKCAPRCTFSPTARVKLQRDALDVLVQVNAQARVAFPLPHMDAPATLQSVHLDGKPAAELVVRDGMPWIALDRGVHQVAMTFRLGSDATSAALHFPSPPPRVDVAAPGWQAAGVDGAKLLSDTLSFTRERKAAMDGVAAASTAQAFPAYVRLARNVSIDLDSTVRNVATRISPAQAGFTVSLPLLEGEHVNDPGFKVEDGHVQVTFKPGQDRVAWRSALDAGSALRLRAPALGTRAEVWRIGSAPLLHLAFSGVPEATAGDDDGQGAAHVFRPLPGETLDVAITRPAAVAGGSVAFDNVMLAAARGDHALESTLTAVARSTRGGDVTVRLPQGADLLETRRDGQAMQLEPHDGHVTLPLQPGVQTFRLRFRDASALGMLAQTPAVSLDAPAANIRTSLELPHDRWVLWTWGPQAGPAVLYWAQLAVLLLVAIALARFAPTPLRWWHWLLLGLGFSTFAWSAFVVVAAWLIALGWRARSDRVTRLSTIPFNLVQVLLGLFTLIALLCLVASVPHGLLGRPDMRIAGMGSTAWSLHWFADRSTGALPTGHAFSLPLWAYKLAMLLWALWLANALVRWMHWGFRAWMRGGYWKSSPTPPKPAVAERVGASGDDAGT